MSPSMNVIVALALLVTSSTFANREVIHPPVQVNMSSSDRGAASFSAVNRVTLQNLSNIEQTVTVSIEFEQISANTRTLMFPLTNTPAGWTQTASSYHTIYNGTPRSVTSIVKVLEPKTGPSGGSASATFAFGCTIDRAAGLLCDFTSTVPPAPNNSPGQFNDNCPDGPRCIHHLVGRFKMRTRVTVAETLGAVIASSFLNIFGAGISSEKMTVNEMLNKGGAAF